jgi:hypothetical protein
MKVVRNLEREEAHFPQGSVKIYFRDEPDDAIPVLYHSSAASVSHVRSCCDIQSVPMVLYQRLTTQQLQTLIWYYFFSFY